MNYPLKPKPRKNHGFRRALIAVAALIVLIYILFSTQSTALFGLFGRIGIPLWDVRNATVTFATDHFAFISSKEALLNENADLRQKLAESQSLSAERDTLLLENDALKGVTPTNGEVARIISSPSESPYDIVVAELMANSHVQAGDTVYGPNAVILGTVLDRSGNLARIEYFSSPGKQTSARLTTDGSEMLLQGEGGGSFLFVAPRGLSIAVGDVVTVPSIQTNILGRVMAVETLRSDSFKNVYISYPLNIFDLEWVSIVHGS